MRRITGDGASEASPAVPTGMQRPAGEQGLQATICGAHQRRNLKTSVPNDLQ